MRIRPERGEHRMRREVDRRGQGERIRSQWTRREIGSGGERRIETKARC